MALAYLCRLRMDEVLSLQKDDWVPGVGLDVGRAKGSKDHAIGVTRRLERVVDTAGRVPGSKKPKYLVPTRSAGKYTVSGYGSDWCRLMNRIMAPGVLKERFSTHDLKPKGVSDLKGHKHKASGHRSYTITDVYDRKKQVVVATR